MLGKLLLLFIIVPAIELILLIQIGQRIGIWPTIGLIVFTGVLGAYFVRRQSVQVLAKIRTQTQNGQLPTDSISDGAFILVAGAFLITPGILTDTVGFLCLIPATRRVIKNFIWSRMQRGIQNGTIRTATYQNQSPLFRQSPDEDVIILDPDQYKNQETGDIL